MKTTKTSGGESVAEGSLNLTLNPPKAPAEGARYKGAWVRLELDDEGKFVARIFGQATYGAPDGQVDRAGNATFTTRELSVHEDIEDPGFEPLKKAMAQVIEAYGPAIESQTMAAAYEARAFAARQDDPTKEPRRSDSDAKAEE